MRQQGPRHGTRCDGGSLERLARTRRRPATTKHAVREHTKHMAVVIHRVPDLVTGRVVALKRSSVPATSTATIALS